MKKTICTLIILSILIVFSCSCTSSNPDIVNNDKPTIVCTSFASYDWICNILGEKKSEWNLVRLNESGTDMHSFQPSAKDITYIADSDLLVFTGGISEEWIDETTNSASDYDGIVYSLIGEEHDHSHDEGICEIDEHIWLSPKNAIVFCEELAKQIEAIGIEETKYQAITSDVFKSLGVEIKSDIESYTRLIEQKWNEFKGHDVEIDPKKKELLDLILQEDLNVSVDIHFDSYKMYNLLLEKLDGRSYNEEKIKKILNIETLDDFYGFISQTTDHNIFSPAIKDDLRGRLLELFFKRYTQFISHDINVTLAGKPITKLSFGQQGTIYLRLQIAANMFSETIIYDQPEDDLDNSFITSELISIFKTIKQYRQIIIVSHNANLVVNSDSEQVIIAQNEDGQLKYK